MQPQQKINSSKTRNKRFSYCRGATLCFYSVSTEDFVKL